MSNPKIQKKRNGMNNINDAGFLGILTYIWKGHITNWFWLSSDKRRNTRERVHMHLLTKELNKMVPFIKQLSPSPVEVGQEDDESIFTVWLQGLENAPLIVRKCIESIRKNGSEKLVVIDDKNLEQYIQLPDFITRKWKESEIIPAHFTDIIRIELLWKYGGYWMDSTNLMTGDFPQVIKDADFVMLMADGKYNPHMFVQNCFIRAKKGDPLLGMWRNLIFEYWKHNGQPKYYFLVQTLFKLLVTNNKEAKRLFDKMPKLHMDPTHVLWHETGNLPFDKKLYDKMCLETFFQKCSYKPQRGAIGVNEILPGSMADAAINQV